MCLLDACICIQNTCIYSMRVLYAYICVFCTHIHASKRHIYMRLKCSVKNIHGIREGGKGGFGSRFMGGEAAVSRFTDKKLVISRNLMNSFLTV